MTPTIEHVIIAALVENPGEHSAKDLYRLVRQVLPTLSLNTFMVRLTYLAYVEKIKRLGKRHHYTYKV